ncbi:PXA domain-containing protein [Irpex rosettiformis]|uniref:PXA domain-containing protein n=1 Tax=Irpex rosettiformis TaxID=378272 RepID=A0ACB8UIT6_9APHY|nr:PXA domain-containing protein [Irpex rosettiformis]
MPHFIGRQGLLLLGLVAVVLPAVVHVLSSPVTVLLLSPLILFAAAVVFLLLNIGLAYILDINRPLVTPVVPPVARPLAFSTPAAWQAAQTRLQWSHRPPQSLAPLHPDSAPISAALNEILILVVRDFVLTWYRDISNSPAFPTAVSATINSSLQRILERTSSLDWPALIAKRIIPKVTAHIEQFRQSEIALRGAGLERRLTQSEELDLLLASRYASRGGGKLHSAIGNLSSTFTKQTEENHLRELVDRALPHVLPEKEAKSRALKIVVREIMACSVLYPVMDMLSDPDFWNRSIDNVAGAAIRQQKLISKVRNVLEAQLPQPRSPMPPTNVTTTERITIHTDTRHFESFLRSISRCSSLLDARRLKNDIMGEIRRTRALLANHENEDWINGEKTEDIVAFLDRLYTAKRKVEKRIVVLGGEAEPRSASLSTSDSPVNTSRLSLRDVLTNPTFLSYFMEFMDRRNRSLPVQFWLTVESFKNPLESVDSSGEDDEEEPIKDPSLSATLKEDISMLNELYFSSPSLDPALSVISKKQIDTVRAFAADPDTASTATERRVRRSVMLSQRQVERGMEQQDFEDFQRSELWFRVLGDSESTNRGTKAISPLIRTASLSEGPTVHPSGNGKSSSTPVPGRSAGASTSSLFGPSDTKSPSRVVVSGAASRAMPSDLELLMSPSQEIESSSSRAPLFDDPEDNKFDAALEVQSKRMEAIQAALTDIIALDRHEDRQDSGPGDSVTLDPPVRPKRTFSHDTRVEEPSDEEVDDVHKDSVEKEEHDSFQLAGPGDLHLSYEIARLSDNITRLKDQEGMLDTLIDKAELTGDQQELKLLQKSKDSLERDLRELNFQKNQYEQQESANRLVSERTRIAITNSTVGEEEGKAVVRYLVEIQQLASDGGFSSGWVVARRYNEFFSMHNRLRERYAAVRNLDFPGKRLVTSLSSSFVDTRRTALEKYLQSLIAIPAVCESEELCLFLSRDSPFVAAPPGDTKGSSAPHRPRNLMQTMYHSVAESIDDMFFGPSMLDVMIQRLTTQTAEFVGIVGAAIHDEDLVAQALRASANAKTTNEDNLLQLSGDLKPLDGETSTSGFSSPICDLILAVFELNKSNNWLRRQAIVIILQQVLGSTIERKLRETVKSMLDEPHLMSYIILFKDSMWESGQLKAGGPPRTAEEKLRTRDDANRKLSALIPDLGANMIGRSNARRGARRLFAVLQNRRLNQHLLYTIVDEIFAVLFSETN